MKLILATWCFYSQQVHSSPRTWTLFIILMINCFILANQSNSPQRWEDLGADDHDDLEEWTLNGRWPCFYEDGLGYDWSYIAQDEPTEFALIAYTSNSQGYGDQLNENDSSGSELFNSVFDSRSSDGDDNQTNDRFKKDNGYHAVPPPLTGNYMPPLADLSFAGLDDSVYRPTSNKTSASVS
ncbi:hypothetical protein Tco_0667976 [Tanacetum coccineum]